MQGTTERGQEASCSTYSDIGIVSSQNSHVTSCATQSLRWFCQYCYQIGNERWKEEALCQFSLRSIQYSARLRNRSKTTNRRIREEFGRSDAYFEIDEMENKSKLGRLLTSSSKNFISSAHAIHWTTRWCKHACGFPSTPTVAFFLIKVWVHPGSEQVISAYGHESRKCMSSSWR